MRFLIKFAQIYRVRQPGTSIIERKPEKSAFEKATFDVPTGWKPGGYTDKALRNNFSLRRKVLFL
jgi:hypothetical protein